MQVFRRQKCRVSVVRGAKSTVESKFFGVSTVKMQGFRRQGCTRRQGVRRQGCTRRQGVSGVPSPYGAKVQLRNFGIDTRVLRVWGERNASGRDTFMYCEGFGNR